MCMSHFNAYLASIQSMKPTMPLSSKPNLPQSVTHICQKAFFKHILICIFFRSFYVISLIMPCYIENPNK